MLVNLVEFGDEGMLDPVDAHLGAQHEEHHRAPFLEERLRCRVAGLTNKDALTSIRLRVDALEFRV